MSSSRYIIVLLMLLLVPALLFGEITAVYTSEPYIYLRTQPDAEFPYTSDTIIGAKLGTLTVTIPAGEVIYSPAWGTAGEVEDGVTLTGPMKSGNSYSISSHIFYVMSVAYVGGSKFFNKFRNNAYAPIIQQQAFTVDSSFTVELWLVNTHQDDSGATVGGGNRPASDFQKGGAYTLPTGFNPVFSFITADSSTNVNSMMNNDGTPKSSGSYVIVNGVEGADSIRIVQSSASYTDPNNPGQPGMTYGDPPQMVSYSVSLTNQSISFNLADAIGTNRKDVNTMTIIVANGKVGTNYSQQVIFTDTSGFSNFRLLPEQGGSASIPFNLFFGGTQVPKGTPILWNTLQNGSNNIKTIQIGGIDQNAIDSLASGTYSATISVEIQNP